MDFDGSLMDFGELSEMYLFARNGGKHDHNAFFFFFRSTLLNVVVIFFVISPTIPSGKLT